jgi:ABC-type phosphate/phosphonate transport system substrate-binding protein
MRDTDLGWMTVMVSASGGPLSGLPDLKGRTLALGSRDSGHAAILPVHFLEREDGGASARQLSRPFSQANRNWLQTRHIIPGGRGNYPQI